MVLRVSIFSLRTELAVRVFDPLDLQDAALLRDIAQRGIVEPLRVKRVGDVYDVIDGARRLGAASDLGMTEIPVIVEGD